MAKKKKGDLNFEINIDKKTARYFKQVAPKKLSEARNKAVEAAGMVWADEAKDITREEDHIDTGLYINSIGYSTGSPSDPIYDLQEGEDQSTLTIGADVSYASALEKRYGIFARALDRSEDRIKRVTETQVKRTLGL